MAPTPAMPRLHMRPTYKVILKVSETEMRTFGEIVRGAAIAAVVIASTTAVSQEPNKDEAALAAAMRGKHLALTTALASLKTHGKPISAKYEYEDGKLK